MTQYWGGKKRLSRTIGDTILEFLKKNGEDCSSLDYWEPMMGMGAVMFRILQKCPDMIALGTDKNCGVIRFWDEIQRGWRPSPKMSKAKYEKLKQTKDLLTHGHVYAGHGVGFHGN